MSELKKMMFGNISDTDESLQSKGMSGKFGLNTGKITQIEFSANAGRDDSPANAVLITAKIDGREFTNRIYEVTRVFDNNNNQIMDTESDEYIKGYNEATLQAMAVIVHTVKAVGVTQAQLDTALAQPKASFTDWAQTVLSLLPPNYANTPVDIFLEYQWNISPNQNRTFLQLPRNMKGGRFLCTAVPAVGAWEEQREWEEEVDGGKETKEGLRYVDKGGNVHPFTRNQNFMESPKAIMQSDEQQSSTAGYGIGGGIPNSTQGSSTSTGTW